MDYVIKDAQTGQYVCNGKFTLYQMRCYANKRGAFRALGRYQTLHGSTYDACDVVMRTGAGFETVLHDSVPLGKENWKDEFIKIIHEFDDEVDPSNKPFCMGGSGQCLAEAECFVQLRERFEAMDGYDVQNHPDYGPGHYEMEEYAITNEANPDRGFTVMKEVYTTGTILSWFS